MSDIDRLAQEIRRVDGAHTLGAGALAEALGPFFEAVRAEEREKAERWKAAADSCGTLLRAVMGELDIRPDEDPVLAVRGIATGIRNDEREKAAQIAERSAYTADGYFIAARIREQGS